MNDPSPESALAEVREMIGKEKNNADYEFAADKAHDLIETHGAHFAALAEQLALVQAAMNESIDKGIKLEAERDGAVRDAERYRTIRRLGWGPMGDIQAWARVMEACTFDELDAAIDAATGKGEGK